MMRKVFGAAVASLMVWFGLGAMPVGGGLAGLWTEEAYAVLGANDDDDSDGGASGTVELSTKSSELCKDKDIDSSLRKAAGCEETETVTSPIKKIVKTLLYIVGIVSVVMVIYAGVQMTISAGDLKKVTQAKMILIYALAGVAISILAYVIVEFVVENV